MIVRCLRRGEARPGGPLGDKGNNVQPGDEQFFSAGKRERKKIADISQKEEPEKLPLSEIKKKSKRWAGALSGEEVTGSDEVVHDRETGQVDISMKRKKGED